MRRYLYHILEFIFSNDNDNDNDDNDDDKGRL